MTSGAPSIREIPLASQPGIGEGLVAVAVPAGSQDSIPRDRYGRPRATRAVVRAADTVPAQRPQDLVTDTEWRWLCAAPHRWSSVVNRLGDEPRATTVCHELARYGCGNIEHAFKHGMIQHPPIRWIPDETLRAAQHESQQHQETAKSALQNQAADLAARMCNRWPGVAGSLNINTNDATLAWIVYAAGDLAAGRSHDGVRAFVQYHHSSNDKARDDLPRLLRDTGWEVDAIRALGVDRSPYIGVGGPIRTHCEGRTLDWAGWSGPHDIRLPIHRDIRISTAPDTRTLLIIENRQAAESICDEYPDIAVLWCRGQHPDRVLEIIGQAAQGAAQTIICTDADLGGVRIAARIHDHLTPTNHSTVVDVAAVEDHPAGSQFAPTSASQLETYAQRNDQIGQFARACLKRGYAVTQEAVVRRALHTYLAT